MLITFPPPTLPKSLSLLYSQTTYVLCLSNKTKQNENSTQPYIENQNKHTKIIAPKPNKTTTITIKTNYVQGMGGRERVRTWIGM